MDSEDAVSTSDCLNLNITEVQSDGDGNGVSFRIRDVQEINSTVQDDSSSDGIKRRLPAWLASNDEDKDKKRPRINEIEPTQNNGGSEGGSNGDANIEVKKIKDEPQEENPEANIGANADIKPKIKKEIADDNLAGASTSYNVPATSAVTPVIVKQEATSTVRDSCQYGIRCYSSDDVINDPTNDMGDDNPIGASTPSTSSSTSVNRRHNSDDPMEQCTLNVEGVNSILFNGEFYEFIERRKKTPYDQKFGGIIVRCVVCKATVKGSLRVSSNFISHMRQKHPNRYQVFKDIKSNIGPKRKNCNANSFHKDLLDFVANTASPLSIIEHKNFVKLFPARNVPSRRTITQLLNNDHEAYISKIKMNLAGIEYLCMAADVWSGGKRSFFGYTCHWIDASSFERKSVALACRRFKGTHSFDHITDLIMSINAEFEVNVNKIICTITDNGSNFVKAFQEFGVKTSSVELESESNDGSDNDADVPIDDDYVELAFQNISPQLSKHFRCASHTLNLLGTKDFINTLQQANDDTVLNKHKTTLSRCATLWSKCNRPKSAEKIKEVLSSSIIKPCVTRWNSLYDCIKKLLTHKHKLNVICQKLKISKFHPSDFDYLAEYVMLMQPIAEALDFLQIEKNMYFGYLLPTLISTKVKLRRLENKKLKYLHTATSKIQEALTKRFEKYFKLEEGSWDAVIAAMVCPDVKLKFFKVLQETAETYTEEDLKYKLRQYARQFVDTTDFDLEGTPSPNSKSNFFDFGDETNNNQASRISLGCDPASREINRFLMDQDESLECLHQYPILKKLFIKYNAPIPSSAPVERLFSFAGIVNTSRRQNLSDKNFEKLVIRKANSILCK